MTAQIPLPVHSPVPTLADILAETDEEAEQRLRCRFDAIVAANPGMCEDEVIFAVQPSRIVMRTWVRGLTLSEVVLAQGLAHWSWDRGADTVFVTIDDIITAGPRQSYRTVQRTLKRLVTKGAATIRSSGRGLEVTLNRSWSPSSTSEVVA
jgi:hypothetical protein